MATLVLSTVGTAVGGPILGAMGAVLGGAIDARLLAPKGRQGPRLGQLAVQTSSYGTAIPKLFGRMRVAGTVIWATDLIETEARASGGKGRPSTTSYSYAASFAVALSARSILRVERIWADGKLLRGAAGDWKSETGFRLHLGHEDQAVDPLIASAEGIGAAPAYRGMAYAVFEEMQLADFGNRIPSLSFEVVADEGPVSVGAIGATLAGEGLTGAAATMLDGYAAAGDSVRGALEGLARVVPLSLRDDGSALKLEDVAAAPVVIGVEELVPDEAGRAGPLIERRAAGALPDAVALSYHEQARDYQTGVQRARREGVARREEQLELPAVLGAAQARGLAEARLARDWAERATARLGLGWRHLGLRPGATAMLSGRAGLWRVSGWTLERDRLALTLIAVQGGGVPLPASAGRALPAADLAHGATRLALLDLPASESGAAAPKLWIAAAGTAPGWRRAALSASLDGGTSWQGIGSTAAPALMGAALTVLAGGPADLIDEAGAVEIELLHDGMALAGADAIVDDAALNLAMLGDELIQFGRAEQLGPRRWRLSRLLRGRRGTEWAIAGHAIGKRFVMIDPLRLAALELAPGSLGGTATVSALGIGDLTAATASATIEGAGLQPPSPVHLLAERLADGAVAIGWTRRSRAGWSWTDGGDVPLGEEAERYRVELVREGGAVRVREVTAAELLYAAAEQAEDGGSGPITVRVRQLGDHAASRAAELIVEP